MIVACNSCGREFEILPKEDQRYIGIERVNRTYFTCPVCGVEYNISFSNSKIRYLQKQFTELQKQSRFFGSMEKYRELEKTVEKMEETKQQIKEEEKEVRRRYETGRF